ncbi:MAG: LLM class flavin-dependent oxidoreductase [Actinomycetota bacterium]|nr:LLM class flavin-dependent oxidoreductase [Actinomycetota bacterium]
MRTSISIGSAYYDGDDWDDMVAFVQAAERLGVDSVWSAEAWGLDAVTPLAYLAGQTERIRLGTGIMQISARAPSMTALSALSLAQLSGDRFTLGLGVSGPQVVEGFHGASFAKPLSRLREHVEIVRMITRGERASYDGEHHTLPLPGGEGKALRTSIRPRADLSIYLATLGTRSLELTGELADGWLGTCFVPEHADVMLDPIRRGAEKAGRTLDDLAIHAGGIGGVGENVEELVARARPQMAFTLGGMGSPKTNFYNAAYSRAGFEDACRDVQQRWVAGDRDGAAAAVPTELVLAANILGTPEMVVERIRAHASAGVDSIRVGPQGRTLDERIANLEQALDLVEQATAHRPAATSTTSG